MGSFHILDGANIRVSYSGQRKTCGRCHQTSLDCPGGAIAKVCEAKNGPRIPLINHMKSHWDTISFSPTSFKLVSGGDGDNENIDSSNFDIPLKDTDKFTPTHRKPNIANQNNNIYSGVVIRNFPPTITEEDIMSFLVSKGLPEEHLDFKISTSNKNKNVDIENINNEICATLISKIHEQIYFNMKIYCRGLQNLVTPKKKENLSNKPVEVRDDEIKLATPDSKTEDKEPLTADLTTPPAIPGLIKESVAKAT